MLCSEMYQKCAHRVLKKFQAILINMLFKQCQLACFQACLLQIDFPISYQED